MQCMYICICIDNPKQVIKLLLVQNGTAVHVSNSVHSVVEEPVIWQPSLHSKVHILPYMQAGELQFVTRPFSGTSGKLHERFATQKHAYMRNVQVHHVMDFQLFNTYSTKPTKQKPCPTCPHHMVLSVKRKFNWNAPQKERSQYLS